MSEERKMISIAMATYNGEKYISQQLDSILRQTVADFELVICDDVSLDATFDILKLYKEKDSRIKIFRNEKNLGFKKNFEKAISLCTGEYIALSDQDDIWTENHLEILLNAMNDNVLACSNVEFIDSSGVRLHIRLKAKDYWVSPNSEKQFLQLLHNNYVQGCTAIFRSEILQRILPIPESAEYHDYWIAFMASLVGHIAYIPASLVLYRRHEETITGSYQRSSQRKLHDFFATPKDFYIKRLNLIQSLENIVLPESRKKLYEEAKKFFLLSAMNKKRMWRTAYFCKNYKYIYCTNNYKFFLLRFIKWLFIVPANRGDGK